MLDGIRQAVTKVASAPLRAATAPIGAAARATRELIGMDNDSAQLTGDRKPAVCTTPPIPANSPAGKLWREAQHEDHDHLRWNGGSLEKAVNAHSTNTVEQMREALESDHGYNWLEGDVRREINDKNKIEMRHDEGHEDGDNLTLKEWLEVGKASGRGLKLDFKEGDAIPEAIKLIKEVGVPEERLMINMGDGDVAKYGELVRRELPNAIIAVNPPDKLDGQENSDGPYEDFQVDRMIEHAKKLGEPVTFVLRLDRVTPEIVAKLEAHGPVSIWNSPSKGGVDDPEAEAAKLREWGVTGVVDVRKSMSNLDKLEAGAEWVEQQGENLVRKGWDAIF